MAISIRVSNWAYYRNATGEIIKAGITHYNSRAVSSLFMPFGRVEIHFDYIALLWIIRH
jgi:hypothetical protein